VKKALVTGSHGFVGRHMVAELQARGWAVVRCDIAHPSMPRDAADYFRGSTQPYDLVVHAAASSPHREAIDNEAEHFAKNVLLDSAMFEWAARTEQRHVIYLSSSAAYPVEMQSSSIYGHLSEDDLDLDDFSAPDAAYGWTKITGEKLAAAARRSGVKVTVVRPFSGYGEDQSENFPFRAIVERVKRREDPLTVWGNGSQTRDWIHISDVVKGMLAVAESGTTDPVNLCTGVGTSMGELVLMAARQAGHKAIVKTLSNRPNGVQYRVGDPGRFHRYYQPEVTLEEGIARALKL